MSTERGYKDTPWSTASVRLWARTNLLSAGGSQGRQEAQISAYQWCCVRIARLQRYAMVHRFCTVVGAERTC
jgi:hypothetical protein